MSAAGIAVYTFDGAKGTSKPGIQICFHVVAEAHHILSSGTGPY